MKNKIKKYLPIIMLLLILIPVISFAQGGLGLDSKGRIMGGIIPCIDNCGYKDLLQLVTNIINWIIAVSIPVCAGVFAWAGFQYMTSSVVNKKEAAKKTLQKVFIGFVFILSAYLIVDTILKALT
jgi:TRAP-type C4-dicarboxylate transport system permease small subunit